MLGNVKVKTWPWSLHITNTCLGNRNLESKMSFFGGFFFAFFSQLESTFSLAVNETKQLHVIRVNVFIQGFYRKLISQGMQSCAKLIGGSWHSGREAVAPKYVFTFMAYSVSATRLSNQTVQNTDYFSNSNTKIVRMWSDYGKTYQGYLSCWGWVIKVTLK